MDSFKFKFEVRKAIQASHKKNGKRININDVYNDVTASCGNKVPVEDVPKRKAVVDSMIDQYCIAERKKERGEGNSRSPSPPKSIQKEVKDGKVEKDAKSISKEAMIRAMRANLKKKCQKKASNLGF